MHGIISGPGKHLHQLLGDLLRIAVQQPDPADALYGPQSAVEFDRLGVFSYSQEEGTPAAGMPDQVEDDLKESRREELMELQQAIAFEKAQEMVGQTLTVMIEGKVAQEDVYKPLMRVVRRQMSGTCSRSLAILRRSSSWLVRLPMRLRILSEAC